MLKEDLEIILSRNTTYWESEDKDSWKYEMSPKQRDGLVDQILSTIKERIQVRGLEISEKYEGEYSMGFLNAVLNAELGGNE